MMVTAGSQAFGFFICICTGCISAVLYNALWYIRKLVNFNKIITFFTDIFFGVFVIISMFYTLQYVSLGEIRFYHFAGFMCGFILLNSFLSTIIRKYVIKTAHFVMRIYKRLQSLQLTKKLFK